MCPLLVLLVLLALLKIRYNGIVAFLRDMMCFVFSYFLLKSGYCLCAKKVQ
jgi:hypothetical protein